MPALDFNGFVKYLKKATTVAVVGATINPQKYGYKIVKELISAGYLVIPVNPKYKRILEIPAVASLEDIKDLIDVIVFVVPPSITYEIIKNLPPKYKDSLIWLQPGSYTPKEVDLLEQQGLTYVAGFCILKDFLLQLKNKKSE